MMPVDWIIFSVLLIFFPIYSFLLTIVVLTVLERAEKYIRERNGKIRV